MQTLSEKNLILYHGSANPTLEPKFGAGNDNNDYGNGLYLTPYAELAKEWAVANNDANKDGYLYKVELDISDFKILDFDSIDELHWLAELMSHRPADESSRYEKLAPIFIKKYKLDTSEYDIIKGWRANSSYFRVAKIFVRDGLDKSLLRKSFHLGDLGIQYFIKSQKAFDKLEKKYMPIENVPFDIYNKKYNDRDDNARNDLHKLEYSKENTMTDVFSNYVKG